MGLTDPALEVAVLPNSECSLVEIIYVKDKYQSMER
jgi:hypothetical protein